MISLLTKLYPLHRTVVSDETDIALEIVLQNLPENINKKMLEYKIGQNVWYWKIPKRYGVKKAILSDEDGNIYADFEKNPLYLWSYSHSIDKMLTWDELAPHLYYTKVRPKAIPWKFKYYENTWGFCVEYEKYLKMPRDKKYRALIISEFKDSPGLKILEAVIDYKQNKDFLICTNICHPYQVNDSLTGLVVAVELAKRFHIKPIKNPTKNIRFLFCPETIGSIAYFANNESLIEQITAAFFCEMLGHKDDNYFVLQYSRNKEDKINKIFEFVLNSKTKKFYCRDFQRWNDEGVINGPGIDIPCPFIMRSKHDGGAIVLYKEYHTSDDSPEIISSGNLIEATNIFEEAIRIFATDYIPKQIKRGLICFSALGLHTSIYDDRDTGIFLDKLAYLLDGNMSIFEISLELKTDYWRCKLFIDKLVHKGAIEKLLD